MWVPLTSAFKTNLFIASDKQSIDYYQKISNFEITKFKYNNLDEQSFINASIGEYLIFPHHSFTGMF